MKKLEKCHHCGEQKEDCYHGFIAMCLPIPEAEAKIEKWNLIDAYKRYLIYTIEGVKNGFDKIKGYLDNCLVEFDGSYKHFSNPSFQYGYRPHTQEEFINKIKTDNEFAEKWYTKNWFENLERTDLTEEEMKELDDLSFYDQMLNTVGRGVQCNDCGKKESELYEKYYPKSLES